MCCDGCVSNPARKRLLERWLARRYVIGYFAIGSVLYLSGLYPVWSTGVDAPIWLRLIVLATACATQALRSRPVIGLVACFVPVAVDGVLGGSAPVLLVLLEHLYNVTLSGSRRASRIVVWSVVTATVMLVLFVALHSSDWREVVVAVLQAGGLLIPVRWAMNVRQHREVADAERSSNLALTRIAELDRHAAVASERAQLARDLHDAVAGHLSAIAIQSEALLSMTDHDSETVRTVLRLIRENSVQSLAEMRSMIDVLRADGEDPATAPSRLRDIDWLIESARAGGLRVESSVELGSAGEELPTAVDLSAYRIVQEALTNAMKHAAGSRTWLSISHDGARVLIEVTNELAHAKVNKAAICPGAGLESMRERARLLGGSLAAGPCERGWRVYAVLPGERTRT